MDEMREAFSKHVTQAIIKHGPNNLTDTYVKQVQAIAFAAHQAALAHRDAQQWLLIESAPRDGTKIWAHEPEYGSAVTWWGTDYNCKDYTGWLSGDGDDFSTGYYFTPLKPTHWQPLPTPPQPIYDKVNLHFNEVKLEAKDE